MSIIDLHCEAAVSLKKHPRYIAHENVACAKQQAYMFRDLVEHHCSVQMPKQGSLDVYSLLFHGMLWTDLMAQQRLDPAPYYGLENRALMALLAGSLSDIVQGLKGSTIRLFMDMPARSYMSARTLEGAKIATAIKGSPTWTLAERNLEEPLDVMEVTDPTTGDRGCVMWFSSDPMTNAECVHCINRTDFKQFSVPVARARYFDDGVDYAELNDPADRWAPTFQRTRAILPKAEAASVEFDNKFLNLADVDPDSVERYLGDATEAFNNVLEKVAEAYWMDTKEINSRENLMIAFGVDNPREQLWFATQNPITKIRELLGQSQG